MMIEVEDTLFASIPPIDIIKVGRSRFGDARRIGALDPLFRPGRSQVRKLASTFKLTHRMFGSIRKE